MKRMLQFRQETTPDHQLLWAVIFDEDGEVVYGRPDAEYVIGFGPVDGYEIAVTATAAFENPDQIIGLQPVFQNGGEMFGVGLAINRVEPFEREESAVLNLREREAEMRKAAKGL